MKTTIRSKGVQLSNELREKTERRLDFALRRFAASIRAVDVQLSEEGSDTGDDKSCQITVRFARGGQLLLSNRGSRLDRTIGRAAERLSQQVARHVGRSRRGRGISGVYPRL